MPIDALRRFFKSRTEKEAEPKKSGKKILIDDRTGESVEIDPKDAEVAADLLSMPMAVRGRTPAQIKDMAGSRVQFDANNKLVPRGMTDTESRRRADEINDAEKNRNSALRAARTGYGGPIRAGDGYLAIGFGDPQPMLGMKKGGKVKSRSSTSGASSRGDGIAKRGKTKGRFV